MQLIKNSIDALVQRYGEASDLLFSYGLLFAYHEGGLWDEALEFIEKLIQKHKILKLECLPGIMQENSLKIQE